MLTYGDGEILIFINKLSNSLRGRLRNQCRFKTEANFSVFDQAYTVFNKVWNLSIGQGAAR